MRGWGGGAKGYSLANDRGPVLKDESERLREVYMALTRVHSRIFAFSELDHSGSIYIRVFFLFKEKPGCKASLFSEA